MTDSATGRKTTYYYDFTDRLMKYVEQGGGYTHSVGYEYDTLNNLTRLVETINGSARSTSYTYDADNRVTSVTDGTSTREYTYDAYGRVSQRVTKHGSTAVNNEGIAYRTVNNKTTGQVATLTNAAGTFEYTYDANGNITKVVFDGLETIYTYDKQNQLIREDNEAAGLVWLWTYDEGGNIQARREYEYGTMTGKSKVVYGYTNSDWGDLLTSRGGKTVTSDAIGNMLSDGTWTYTWEHGRELASMSSGGTTWSFTYDANGMRTSRTNGSTTYSYVYNGGQLSRMTMGPAIDATTENTITLDFTYDASGTPLSVNYNGTYYYYVTDLQGDVVAIVDTAGVKVVEYLYDAWGRLLITGGTKAADLGVHNPLRYRGYVYDPESGLYYLQSRYYNPTLGRFINADAFASTGQGILGNNMFAYCSNNPVNYSDPSGEFGLVTLGIIISGVIGGVVSAASTAASGASIEEVIVNGVIGAGSAAGTAAVAASSLSLGAVAFVSAGIGAISEITSQGAEYLFHKDDADYERDLGESIAKVLYSAGMNSLGGTIAKGINTVFAATDAAGTFVSGIASTGLGGMDFGARQIIGAVMD